MKDKDGFQIRCIHSEWKIIDQNDNKDFVCTKYNTCGYHECYGNDYCRDYKPVDGDAPADRPDW